MQDVDEVLSSLKIYNKEPGNINTEYHVRVKEKENIEISIGEMEISLVNIEEQVQVLDETKMLLETLKTYKLQEKKDFILRIINTALNDIFNDNIRIDIEAQEKKTSKGSSQKYDIVFYQNDIEMARNEELLITNGGGIMQVISMLFKILIGYIYSKNTFYIFDESFSQLSGDNRARLSKFLKEFCDKFNFTLVVVSQVHDLDEHADIIYDVDAQYNDKGIRTLKIVNAQIPDDLSEGSGFWQLDIHNFQSIEKEQFFFKGYTIIRGPNNSGKSASLRAINAILYNSFDTKKYPRKTISSTGVKKTLPVHINLSKIKMVNGEQVQRQIALNYKNTKVSFVINGNEYYGKNLASEKLREAVEEIGFKYINLKEFYKNFKGNLKDQTERIASTTQYDSLFLVGNKGSETEKVFNFLFNTENISIAIQRIKEDMVLLNKEYLQIQENILTKADRLNILDREINLLSLLYYILSTRQYLDIFAELESTQLELEDRNSKIAKLDLFISDFQFIEPLLNGGYDNLNNSLLNVVNTGIDLGDKMVRLSQLENVISQTPLIIEKMDFCTELQTDINKLQDNNIIDNSSIKSKSIKIEKINSFQEIGLHFIYIKESLDYVNNINSILEIDNKRIITLRQDTEQLKIKHQVHECKDCSGHGYTIYHKEN